MVGPWSLLRKGPANTLAVLWNLLLKKCGKKIYITSWGKIKAELVSELNQCAALLGYLFQK